MWVHAFSFIFLTLYFFAVLHLYSKVDGDTLQNSKQISINITWIHSEKMNREYCLVSLILLSFSFSALVLLWLFLHCHCYHQVNTYLLQIQCFLHCVSQGKSFCLYDSDVHTPLVPLIKILWQQGETWWARSWLTKIANRCTIKNL